jgi:hypothetical protein
MQGRALGGLSARTRRRLGGPEPAAVRRHRTLRPGTVLVREWHGVGHQVTILNNGVLYRGECYRSLSEVARLITGPAGRGRIRPQGMTVKAARVNPTLLEVMALRDLALGNGLR